MISQNNQNTTIFPRIHNYYTGTSHNWKVRKDMLSQGQGQILTLWIYQFF